MGRWRAARDVWADRGVPAHVTLLGPHLPRLDARALEQLRAFFAAHQPVEVVFERTELLNGALCLVPRDPPVLLDALGREWPNLARPRRAHLTVARAGPYDEIERELRRALPLHATLREAQLLAADADGAVSCLARFPLGAACGAASSRSSVWSGRSTRLG